MDFFFVASQYEGAIIGPFAKIIGFIMNAVFNVCNSIGIANVGLCIILITVIIKLLMLPMTIKQQKSARLNSVMQPEIQAITEKYKGKTDQASMMKQRQETQAVYDKYGTSMMGGCLQLLIQMPILLALYRVVYCVPGYISAIKEVYMNIVTELMKVTNYADVSGFMDLLKSNLTLSRYVEGDELNPNKLVDMMYAFDKNEWQQFIDLFPQLQNVYDANIEKINHMNLFLGINLSGTPMSQLWPAIFIPILAGLTQWISSKMADTATKEEKERRKKSQEDNPMASTMNSMMVVMPLMSVFFCFTFNCSVGVYWIASSVCQIIVQFFVNRYMQTVDINDLIAKNQEKVNRKRIRRGEKPIQFSQSAASSLEMYQEQALEEERQRKLEEEERLAIRDEQIREGNARYGNAATSGGTIAERARMVQTYNDTHKK